jgi:hypothetical protein
MKADMPNKSKCRGQQVHAGAVNVALMWGHQTAIVLKRYPAILPGVAKAWQRG